MKPTEVIADHRESKSALGDILRRCLAFHCAGNICRLVITSLNKGQFSNARQPQISQRPLSTNVYFTGQTIGGPAVASRIFYRRLQ
jgi:hypothetical protein